jgi:dolichol-phosphate mannosyltransferase
MGVALTAVDVSVIIPTVNESENISRLIFDLHEGLARNGMKHEVIVVDDDSTDDTAALVSQISVVNPGIKLLSRMGRRPFIHSLTPWGGTMSPSDRGICLGVK